MLPTAWVNNKWCSLDSLALQLFDRGVLQGAVLVERLRTCNGHALDVAEHVDRLMQGCRQLGICIPPDWDMTSAVHECASKQKGRFSLPEKSGGQVEDFGLVIVATPGVVGASEPTVIIHPDSLPWKRLASWYNDGQCLVISEQSVVPSTCWPATLKTRSRLHYYLADRKAAAVTQDLDQLSELLRQHSGAVLVDAGGNLMETSMANLLLVKHEWLVCPPLDTVLNGISLRRTLRLAEAAGLPIRYEPIEEQRVVQCDELLLCGSVGSLWGAACWVDSRGTFRTLPGPKGAVLVKLQQAWFDDIGLDFVQQAFSVKD